MKINMLIRYLINKLSDEQLQNVWCILQTIKDSLDYKKPLNSISVNLHQEKCNISPDKVYDILEYLQWKGTLKILKTNKFLDNLRVIPVKIIGKKFNAEYNEVKTEIENRSKEKREPEFINEIICVRPKQGNKFTVVINKNYNETIKGDMAKPSWNLLFEVAKEKEIWYDTKSHKSYLDYFNSNKNNRLYTQTGNNITQILKVEGGLIMPNIKMSVISEKAFKTRLRKAKRSLKIA